MVPRPGTDRSLFLLCSGLGLGNASRCVGILQALRARPRGEDIRVTVLSWGKAIPFLLGYASELGFTVVELEGYRIRMESWRNGVAGMSRFLAVYARNTRLIWKELKAQRPQVALLDSDYHFLPFLVCRVPVVSLGQASDVLRRAKRFGGRPGMMGFRTWVSLFLFEKLDAFVQRHLSRIVLVPSFDPDFPRAANLIPVPLIVRSEFLQGSRAPAAQAGGLCVVLSGSGIGSEALVEFARVSGIPVFGASRDKPDSVVREGVPCIDGFDAVITQGGLSSISECLARNKVVFVLPIRHHAEQKLNALQIEESGLGSEITERDLDLKKIRGRLGVRSGIRGIRTAWSSPRTDGSIVSADYLVAVMEGSSV